MEVPSLKSIHESGRNWAILAGEDGEPKLILDSGALLRGGLFGKEPVEAYKYCHRPLS